MYHATGPEMPTTNPAYTASSATLSTPVKDREPFLPSTERSLAVLRERLLETMAQTDQLAMLLGLEAPPSGQTHATKSEANALSSIEDLLASNHRLAGHLGEQLRCIHARLF